LAASGCDGDESHAASAPPPPAVTVATPVTREVTDFNEYTGKLMAADEVEIRAKVRGYLESIGFKDGDEVKKGQLLFQIDPRPFDAAVEAAEGRVAQVKAEQSRADADVKRYKDLVPKGAATQQDLDKAIAQLGVASAGIQSAEAELKEAKLNQEYAKLSAPIDGMASKSQLDVGNLVGAGGGEQLLTKIVQMDPIHVCFDVDQRGLQQYREAALKRRAAAGEGEPRTVRELNIKVQFGLASEEGFPHEGVIDFIDNEVNRTTGTISVRAETSNAKRLFRPGFFARVRIATGPPYKASLVSERAIGTQQGQKYVLVVNDKDQVEFRPVQLGALQSDGLRVIRSGIKEGERVVVNGIQRARPGSTVKPEAGEMPAHKPPTTGPATVAQTNSGR
jgi:RND family efflux transporter MFP subunit